MICVGMNSVYIIYIYIVIYIYIHVCMCIECEQWERTISAWLSFISGFLGAAWLQGVRLEELEALAPSKSADNTVAM